MEQRIRDFEPLWTAIHLPMPRPPLVRCTNEHELLPFAALAAWRVGTEAERNAIMAEHLPERAQDPLDYEDPWADDVYDMEYAAY